MTCKFNFIYITNTPSIGSYLAKNGVKWVMVDLEYQGKSQRQKGRDTVVSAHTISDVRHMRAHLNQESLLVRVNPLHESSRQEIEAVIKAGADAIMLPYFRKKQEVAAFVDIIASRCKAFLLLETLEGIQNLQDILSVSGIDYVHIGLNDLHIERETKFMFEFISDGSIEPVATILREQGHEFGFGGVGRYGQLSPPAECVLTEHVRLGSCGTILSRSFMNASRIKSVDEFCSQFRSELKKLRGHLIGLKNKDSYYFDQNKKLFAAQVANVVEKIDEK